MGVNAALGPWLQVEQAHDIIVPKTPVRSEYDFLGGIFNEMAAGDHRQVPDITGILAHTQLPFPFGILFSSIGQPSRKIKGRKNQTVKLLTTLLHYCRKADADLQRTRADYRRALSGNSPRL